MLLRDARGTAARPAAWRRFGLGVLRGDAVDVMMCRMGAPFS